MDWLIEDMGVPDKRRLFKMLVLFQGMVILDSYISMDFKGCFLK